MQIFWSRILFLISQVIYKQIKTHEILFVDIFRLQSELKSTSSAKWRFMRRFVWFICVLPAFASAPCSSRNSTPCACVVLGCGWNPKTKLCEANRTTDCFDCSFQLKCTLMSSEQKNQQFNYSINTRRLASKKEKKKKKKLAAQITVHNALNKTLANLANVPNAAARLREVLFNQSYLRSFNIIINKTSLAQLNANPVAEAFYPCSVFFMTEREERERET